MQSQLSN